MSENVPTAPAGDIVARASKEYRIKRYLMVALLFGWGVWSLYDGYIGYPKKNQKIADIRSEIKKAEDAKDEAKAGKLAEELRKAGSPHSEGTFWSDVSLNRKIGWSLIPVSLALLAFALHNSRGEYRLRGNIVNVPGHPPVPLERVKSIDKADWDRKGIAYVDYELVNGATGTFRLDDFIYERKPTDDIFAVIEKHAGSDQASEEPAET
jgi:hypothetical protein